MKLLLLAVLTTGCGGTYKVKGTTTHNVNVSGAVDVKIDADFDFNVCQQFTDRVLQEKCLDAIIGITATLEELKAEQEALKIPVNN